MSWIESWLTHLETRLKAMFEGESARDSIPRALHNQISQGLVQAMRAGANNRISGNDQDGQVRTAPDQYTLVLPTEQAQLLLSHPANLDRLARMLEISAAQQNIVLAASPMLRVVADPNISALQVMYQLGKDGSGESATLELDGSPVEGKVLSPANMPNAFLIVNGLATFHLNNAVINIGSDPANQLVLEDPGVSRSHAQLRFSSGHFVIFDLDSKEGVFVNGVAVTSHLLNPGDVILLACVPLVYGEETATVQGYTQELPAEPPPLEVL